MSGEWIPEVQHSESFVESFERRLLVMSFRYPVFGTMIR